MKATDIMQFLFPTLTWAFLLVLIPVLIHLINLMRQKKVQWAAMEFLLASNRKHRRWIWLKQFLLLLLRMIAVAMIVAMLAGLITQDSSNLFGGRATHHFIFLDDSLSMSDRSSDGRAMDRASQALRRIAEQLQDSPTDQKVTLLRFSQATKAINAGETAADLNAVTVDSEFAETMEEAKRRFDVTDLAVSPLPALEMLEQLMSNAVEDQRVAYVLSDFRANEWKQTAEIKEALRGFRENGSDVHLIRCVDDQHPNLAIVDVLPGQGTLAAGVPLFVNVKVRNFGPHAAQQVAVRMSAKSYPEDLVITSDEQVPEEQVTSVLIDEIPVGETVTRQCQLKFDRAGQHLISASLNSDSLVADNVRSCLVDIPAGIPVLLIDGSGQNEEAYYLQSVFAPGRVVTGINAVARTPAYLRDASDSELSRYAAIYLFNVERLDAKAVAGLERFAHAGGGVAFFVGPNTDPAFLLQLHADGKGLFPIPVRGPRDAVRLTGDETPALQVRDHPIFRVLVAEGGENRPLVSRIRIDRYLAPDPDWDPANTPATEVLATLQGSDPIVVSRVWGDGQVVAFLTTASPTWNNWALGPSFPVVVLQLHGFLSSPQNTFQAGTVGEPIAFQLDTTLYQPNVDFVIPASEDGAPTTIQLEPNLNQYSDAALIPFTLGRSTSSPARTGETDRRGVYVTRQVSLDGQERQRRFVLNVPTFESDLAVTSLRELNEQFDDLDVSIHSVDELEFESNDDDVGSWQQLLLAVIVMLLLGEQLLAYSASYHPKGGSTG